MAIDKRLTVKIDLDFPIMVSGVEVKHLVMRRPKVRDEIAYAKASGSAEDKVLLMMCTLTETPQEDLMELDAADWSKLEEQYVAFKGARPQNES